MSSPAPNFASSPFSITSPRRIPKSKFTYKHLHQLKSYSPQTPLRVIAHVDLDAFYAQCETVRLGLDPSLPLAVQQWQGLIAINYPARAFGLSRHVTSSEALKQCPDLILQHVATWKEGDEKWAYHEDSFKNMATHKVSLDPYRLECRRILKCIKESLPDKEQRVEKASIDEVFMDLSGQIHTILLERYPELRGPAPYDDPTERLPKVPTTVLDWAADALVETGEEDGEDQDPDWDDVCTVIASEIVRDVRKNIKEKLGYTCSGGVAKNKMLAKLGSGYKKPNQQTVIRNRAIKHFLSDMKFTKIRMLGGKLGDEAVAMFGTDLVKSLMEQPLEQLKKLGDDTGSWLYNIIRGEDHSEVNPRTQIKSMLSAKSFRPAINSFEQGVVVDGRAWPCANLSLSVGGFEDGITNNKGIGSFLVRGEEAKAMMSTGRSVSTGEPPAKRRKTKGNIAQFFGPKDDKKKDFDAARAILLKAHSESTREEAEDDMDEPEDEDMFEDAHEEEERRPSTPTLERHSSNVDMYRSDTPPSAQPPPRSHSPPSYQQPSDDIVSQSKHPPQQKTLDTYFCAQCNIHLPTDEKAEHIDYHFALDLSKEMRHEERNPPAPQPVAQSGRKTPTGSKPTRGRGRPPGGGGVSRSGGAEKGQAKLAFGRQG
ncbi:hypothetical protein SNOG_14888 [Parastagonospora nodorum SN15]|uniref:UmuC domain-containing protein n=1 Tax=Phaeosphaeria nodorum (strain SN15 / ATCC MYA-4574 / FGSC 10173) TaxID=321614 RepID=Q0U034_PHANO|nr:hypothetical protein SNOG_14888 [Parastagonospora nodorum SN15]EAT77740.2 hypothetical protein SNOG_14888 [Parastagonospora nodorum SN15]